MEDINYSGCSKDELAEILNHIDQEKYPDRAAKVQQLYESLGGTEEYRKKAQERPKRFWWGFIFIVYAPFVLIYGVQSDRLFYSINIESLCARVVACLVLVILGIMSLREWKNNEN